MNKLFAIGLSCLILAACSGTGTAAPPSRTVYIEVGSGDAAIYLVSDNLDPSSWPDDASSHKVKGLPDGAAQVCKYTTSQGTNYVVWTTGSADSTDLARAQCQRMGQ